LVFEVCCRDFVVVVELVDVVCRKLFAVAVGPALTLFFALRSMFPLTFDLTRFHVFDLSADVGVPHLAKQGGVRKILF
jgi:hypothetical protein